MQYPVAEVFDTVQGEGHFTGTPCTFIRLQGCDVGCAWCDTKHTWPFTAGVLGFMSVDALVARVPSVMRHVVITGGEPCAHDLVPLTEALHLTGRVAQIETSGTYPIRAAATAYVTVSPKIGKARPMQLPSVRRADEIKHVVGRHRDVEDLTGLLDAAGIDQQALRISLQPMSQSKAATALCVSEATARGWRVSIQMHKYIGIQ